MAIKLIPTKPWRPLGHIQQNPGGHQAKSKKTLTTNRPIPTRPWQPPSQI